MKKCSVCKEIKQLNEFSWRNKSKGVRQDKCKSCHKEYAREHYTRNKEAYIDRAQKNKKDYRPRGKAFIIKYLSTHPCVDCGNDDIDVLEFDHVEPLNNFKAPRVSNLLSMSIKRILEEIEKCEVRCANCHLKQTRKRAGTLRTNHGPLAE